jgi:hypothetical protein
MDRTRDKRFGMLHRFSTWLSWSLPLRGKDQLNHPENGGKVTELRSENTIGRGARLPLEPLRGQRKKSGTGLSLMALHLLPKMADVSLDRFGAPFRKLLSADAIASTKTSYR